MNFTPNAIASFNGGLVLTSNASNGTVSVTLQGSGTAVPAPILSVGPSSLAFGSQTLNVASATQFITLQNTGNAPANLSTINLTGSAMFAATNAGACGNAIAAGSSCTLGFRFTPTAASAQSATLQVLSNALGSPHQVALSGTGTALPTPSPALSQSALYAFTGTTVGQTNGTSLTATASNGGTAAYRVQSVSLSGTHISDFVLSGTCVANLSISPGNTCTVIVSFKPGNTGLLTARVNLLTDGGTTLGFDVDGTGTAVATTSAQLSSSNIALGTVLVGNVSAISKTTLSNTGNQNLTVNSISIAMPFSLATGTCLATPFVLAPGVACDIAIKFAPATATASSITLAVTTAAPGPSLQATVTGIGTLAPVTSGKLTSALDLGSILVGGSSAVLKSTLQNDGNQNLMVTSVNVAAPFALATGTCAAAPFTLAPGGTCDFGLSFTPNTAAPYSAALIVNTAAPGPTMQTTLTGLGTAPPAVNGGTSTTGGATTTAGATTGTGAGMTTATTPTDTSTTATSTTGTAAAAPKATDPVTSTPTNIGAGGCTMSRDGNDASMLLLLLAALLTGWWRGSFSPKRSVER